MSEWVSGAYGLHVLHRADTPPGPAARWLIERFAGQASAAGQA